MDPPYDHPPGVLLCKGLGFKGLVFKGLGFKVGRVCRVTWDRWKGI